MDHAVDEGWLRFAVLDGMGHGLRSAQLAVLAVTAHRRARRAGKSLTATAEVVDGAVHGVHGGDAVLTTLFADVDTSTGALTWLSAGHPAPLPVRDGRIVEHLLVEPSLPLGLGAALGGRTGPGGNGTTSFTTATEQLQPRDQVVSFTDGVTEAPSLLGWRSEPGRTLLL